jgi:hypothetical protein
LNREDAKDAKEEKRRRSWYLLFFLGGFPGAAVEVKRIVFTYGFPTFKTQKKPLPRLVIPGTVESRGRLGTAIAIFDSDCPGHCYSVLNNNGLLRAGEYHAAGASLQGAGDYDSGFAADIAASCFYDNHCAVIQVTDSLRGFFAFFADF